MSPKNNRIKIRDPATGQFKGAHPRAGRPKGVPNKTTTVLKEAILRAAANAGDWMAQERIDAASSDGQVLTGPEADGGLVGYLFEVARTHPTAFVPLLAKVLPLVVKADVNVDLRDEYIRRAEHFTQQLQRLTDRNGSSGSRN